MATIVRVRGRNAEWTPEGWQTGDAQLDQLCDIAQQAAPFRWDPNPQQAAAESLATALQGEIVSVQQQEDEEIPVEAVY